MEVSKNKPKGDVERDLITADDIITTLLVIGSLSKCLARKLIVEQEKLKKEEIKRGFKI